jgi:hypothetical protein
MNVEYQNKHVPRFLFRAWHSESGGGQAFSINTESEIVPHGLMHRGYPNFYGYSEHHIESLVEAHISMRSRPLTEFSSWSASLHAVLCYGAYMSQHHDVYISVIDTQQLENVAVFNTGHLIGELEVEHRVIEYLAHGCISGRGYKAVSLRDMEAAGLARLFPLEHCRQRTEYDERLKVEAFGFQLRNEVFSRKPKYVSSKELSDAGSIAALFKRLALPVITALLCLEPRIWQNFRANRTLTNEQDIEKVLGAVRGLRMIPKDTWLQTNMVYTLNSPDIDQWIDLLDAIAEYGTKEGSKYRYNDGLDEPEDTLAETSEHGSVEGSEGGSTRGPKQGRRSNQNRYSLRPFTRRG